MTMYLSQLQLNPRNVGVARDIASRYGLHQTLKRAFPEGEDKTNRTLFRVEASAGGGITLLVQTSTDEPVWSSLLGNGYALRADGPKHFEVNLRPGQCLNFRLEANPTLKRDGKRIPLVHVGQNRNGYPSYMDWLNRKASAAGFSIAHVVDAPFRVTGRSSKRIDKSSLPLFGVRFDGTLIVMDPAAVRNAVLNGVGPAKAFGFGLLSLARTP